MTILFIIRPDGSAHRRHCDTFDRAYAIRAVFALDRAEATALPGFREMADTLRWEDIR